MHSAYPPLYWHNGDSKEELNENINFYVKAAKEGLISWSTPLINIQNDASLFFSIRPAADRGRASTAAPLQLRFTCEMCVQRRLPPKTVHLHTHTHTHISHQSRNSPVSCHCGLRVAKQHRVSLGTIAESHLCCRGVCSWGDGAELLQLRSRS